MNINDKSPNVGEALTNRIKELRQETKTTEKKEFVDNRPSFFTGTSKYGADKVQVSDESKAIAQTLNDFNNEPEVDMEKVEKIREALQRGSYKIDYDKVAKALLKEDLFNSAL